MTVVEQPVRPLSWLRLFSIELYKLVDTRSVQISLIVAAVVTALGSWALTRLVTSSLFDGESVTFDFMMTILVFPTSLAALWVATTGATADWQHNTAVSQFPLIKSRLAHFLARVAATLVVTVALTAAAIGFAAVTFLVSAATSNVTHVWSERNEMWSLVGSTMASGALTALLGVGVGSLVRRSVLSIATCGGLFVLSLVLMGIVRDATTQQVVNILALSMAMSDMDLSGEMTRSQTTVGVIGSTVLWYVMPLVLGGYRHVRGEVG